MSGRSERGFLLLGDGHFKNLVDRRSRRGIEDRVVSTGRVPQVEGARLLKACDIYVSPHSAHMIDSKFFGSPTKVFEYMALGGGIVASDLEQIGQVLSPSLTPEEASAGAPVTDERAVLCMPGNVAQFRPSSRWRRSEMVRVSPERPSGGGPLLVGRHVTNIWLFAAGERFRRIVPACAEAAGRRGRRGDAAAGAASSSVQRAHRRCTRTGPAPVEQ